MMLRHFSFMLIAATSIALTSCDEGRIYPETTADTVSGNKARLTVGHIDGLESWGGQYKVALAAFNPGDDYAVAVKNLDTTTTDAIDITLNGLSAEVESVELCVLDGLRRRVATLAAVEPHGDDVVLEVESIDAGMFTTLQTLVFSSTCANCHGASNSAAAGLYLTEGRSYESLIGVPSTLVEGAVRVEPGDAAHSVLYRAVTEPELTSAWHYDHSVEIPSTTTLDMLKAWINAGAKP